MIIWSPLYLAIVETLLVWRNMLPRWEMYMTHQCEVGMFTGSQYIHGTIGFN